MTGKLDFFQGMGRVISGFFVNARANRNYEAKLSGKGR